MGDLTLFNGVRRGTEPFQVPDQVRIRVPQALPFPMHVARVPLNGRRGNVRDASDAPAVRLVADGLDACAQDLHVRGAPVPRHRVMRHPNLEGEQLEAGQSNDARSNHPTREGAPLPDNGPRCLGTVREGRGRSEPPTGALGAGQPKGMYLGQWREEVAGAD